MDTLFEALVTQLKDLYSAENQLVIAMPYLVEAASDSTLNSTLLSHFSETEEQIERLEAVSTLIGRKLSGHECRAMRGLIREAAEAIEDDYRVASLRDIMIVAAAQRIEHYEIAGYGNAIALADYLDLTAVSALLRETIEEEGNADKALTSLCQAGLFGACESESPYGELRL